MTLKIILICNSPTTNDRKNVTMGEGIDSIISMFAIWQVPTHLPPKPKSTKQIQTQPQNPALPNKPKPNLKEGEKNQKSKIKNQKSK